MKASIIVAMMFLVGCTDGQLGKITALGQTSHVECYSGTLKIYDGHSTGIVEPSKTGAGWFFKEQGSGDFIRVNGNCIVRG